MSRIAVLVAVLGICTGYAWSDDTKPAPEPKIISKTELNNKFGELEKISSTSLTLKVPEQVANPANPRKPKTEHKEINYTVNEKTTVKFIRVPNGDPKEVAPKVEEIAKGEKVTLHLTLVKTKGSDGKITEDTIVTKIEVTQKPKSTTTTPSTTSKP